jgi:hypothetical protein
MVSISVTPVSTNITIIVTDNLPNIRYYMKNCVSHDLPLHFPFSKTTQTSPVADPASYSMSSRVLGQG